MIRSEIVPLCKQRHNLDDWVCIRSLWGPQSDDKNLSVRTWVDLLDPSEGPFGRLRYFSPYTHNVIRQSVGVWSNTPVPSVPTNDVLRPGSDAIIVTTIWA